MKWKKYMDLLLVHPYIANDLGFNGTLHTSEEFVRNKVGFIAFRPFRTLDMAWKRTSKGIRLPLHDRFLPRETYTETSYQIVFRIAGEPKSSRVRYVSDGEENPGDGSIGAHIDDLVQWHASCDKFQDRWLMWERVIKKSVTCNSEVGVVQINLEIYNFPAGFDPKVALGEKTLTLKHFEKGLKRLGDPPLVTDEETVRKALETFNDRERQVLTLLFWNQMEISEVAKRYQVTKERINQIYTIAMRQLRNLVRVGKS